MQLCRSIDAIIISKILRSTSYPGIGNISKSSFSSAKLIMAGLEKVILGMGMSFCSGTMTDHFLILITKYHAHDEDNC